MAITDIQIIPEPQLTNTQHHAITNLRNSAFPDHQVKRSYFKQLPHSRVLLMQDGELVGHLGLDHRMISVAGEPLKILGVIDLCIKPALQGQGLASQMLTLTSQYATEAEVDFIFLIARVHDLYLKHGFQRINAKLKFLHIKDQQSISLAEVREDGTILIKPIQTRPWPKGDIDLMGYLF